MKEDKDVEEVLLCLSVSLPDAEREAAGARLLSLVRSLVNNDFSALLHLLYRVDVDEKKLRQLLRAEPGKDAAELISGLIIERLAEKRRIREALRKDPPRDNEEKW
ncbi:MAG TPA: hypothetical protein VFR58_07345 [Flavisolibacter sp.]|nr:hypothetical protein [Flavisolibacter sp.]